MPADKFVVHVIDDDEAVRRALDFQLESAGIGARGVKAGCKGSREGSANARPPLAA
jgi:FixJ family two-component response regulator